MKSMRIALYAIAVALIGLGGFALAAQDRNSVSVPDGLSFAEFKGYAGWEDVAVSGTQTSIKLIAANPVMMRAFRQGAPAAGKTFPEGSRIVKIEWLKKKSAASPYFVEIPDTLKTVSFIVKDTKRFPDTHGWAYAQFAYDPATQTFKPSAPLSSQGHECGYACHSAVAGNDYIFTAYPKR